MNPAVAITGWGAVSALGVGRAALWPALRDGRTGIRAIERFSTEALTVHRGGCVPGYDARDHSPAGLCDTFSRLAAEEALQHAGHGGGPLARTAGARTALVFGTSIIVDTTLERPAARLAEQLGLSGPVFTVSTACTSSTYAIGLARDLLLDERQGVDVVLAGGADVLTIELQAGFHALGVLTRETCQPFGRVTGTSLGEGAGFVVLERRAQAAERTRATLLGYGLSGDAYHETSPEPRGRGVAQATRAALRDARVDASRVRYVNLHGTGTEANDPAECVAMREVFGALGVEQVRFSSSKGHLGHAQGAAGVLELVVTLEALDHGHFPGTAGLEALRTGVNLPVLGATCVAEHPRAPFVSCNSAFAGSNAALVAVHGAPVPVGEADALPSAHRVLPALFLHGAFTDVAGACNARGEPLPCAHAHAEGRHLTALRTPARADTRGHDRATQLLLHGVLGALASAGLVLRGAARERTGLFVGMLRPSPESTAAFRSSLAERGAARPDVGAFARVVLNAALGAVAKTLDVRGPESSLVSGAGSGLAALYAAARLLETHDDVDQLVVAAVDVLDDEGVFPGQRGLPQRDAVVALVLSKQPPAPGTVAVRLAGLGIAGAGQRALASTRAGGESGTRSSGLALELPATGDLVDVAAALRAIVAGETPRVCVVSEGGTVSVAAVLERMTP